MPIDIRPDAVNRDGYVRNVMTVWSQATPDQLGRGMNWYRTANQLAEMISGGNVAAGAGVLAALSANKSWGENVKLATRAFTSGEPSGHVGDAIRKAARIMSGEAPESVLPMDSKTGHFYRCILDPTDPHAICIDRHAHDIAVGVRFGNQDRGLGAAGRYALLAGIYREAAFLLGTIPQIVQAVTWVVWIESKGN
ncbi:hypothetical protein Ssi03_13140 [Sphaerisporangium siamense]|uniref:Uncharacterized protein n=1 Tax=Sphaerisporangium siamense TaxID=795645 RepID=A0A7W7D9U3_9ACTN|nr:hypothetical protein [Sphaerisporangium siamense]MBB4702917.1 hypothetical protein [Sphaerisporangium siamense]GII83324.1 hypothetical protein Ssi03_13140 [Sphaerisporangium siamense]